MVRNSGIWYSKLKLDGILVFLFVVFNLVNTLMGLRPLKEMDGSIHEQHSIGGDDESEFGPFSSWNVTGTYKGRWSFMDSDNRSNVLLELGKSHGLASFELVSSPTKITGVHYIHGLLIFGDMSDSDHDRGDIRLRVEGVYIWPFRQLRLVASSGTEVEPLDDDLFPPNPYHILGAFSSQLLQSSPQHRSRLGQNSLLDDIGKHCNLQIAAQFSRISSNEIDGDHSSLRMDGVVESPSLDEDGDCFLPIALNATSVNIGVYYSKAVNYTLMVTFVSFLQVLMLIRQMEHSNTQSGAAKVSLLMIGQQAIIDAYLCLLHLTAGILIESLFNAFATAAFFKFVVFAIFEMRYLLAIWKASRASNPNDGWETMRRDLSTLYSRFYGILLGGIIFMYELHSIIPLVLFLLYSFWIPQIVSNVIRDTRKPLHPYYVLGISISRLAVPLYIFGCPNNFLRIETDMIWCYCLIAFVGIQAFILILQHYLGSRCFIPRQILPEKYDYHRRIEQGASQVVDCVICMTPIDFMQRSNDSMVTPCDHFFHSGCLQRWMDIKMECPTCRRPLPPA